MDRKGSGNRTIWCLPQMGLKFLGTGKRSDQRSIKFSLEWNLKFLVVGKRPEKEKRDRPTGSGKSSRKNRVEGDRKSLCCLGRESPGNFISQLEVSRKRIQCCFGRNEKKGKKSWLDSGHAYFEEILVKKRKKAPAKPFYLGSVEGGNRYRKKSEQEYTGN